MSTQQHRGLRARHVIGGLLVAGVIAAAIIALSNRSGSQPLASVENVAAGDLGDAVQVGSGRISLAKLASSAPDAITASGDGYTINKPIVVTAGGTLDIGAGTVTLTAGDKPAVIEARGGQVKLDGTTVKSAGTGSPGWIAARDGGKITSNNVTLDGIGGIDAHRAIEVTGQASSAVIRRTTVSGGSGIWVNGGSNVQLATVTIQAPKVTGVQINGGRRISLTNVKVSGATGNGIAVLDRTDRVTITGADVQSSGGHAMALGGASSNITVTDSLFQQSVGAGVAIDSAYGVDFKGVRLVGNDSGIDVTASSNDITITESRLASNRVAGLQLSSPGSVASVSSSEIEHNGSGVLVHDGNAQIGPSNTITSNNIGINLLDSSPGVTVTNNNVTNNFGDGMFLVTKTGVDVRKNTFRNNEFASFGVLTSGDSAEWRKTNTVDAGVRFGWERVLLDFESRIVTGAAPAVPSAVIPEVETYYVAVPKAPTGVAGSSTPNPLTTPNNLPATAIADAVKKAEEAARAAALRTTGA